jgi:hypothetical protein
MKFANSLLIGTGSVVLAGFALTLLAPKAMHAVVATLVQVANTTANPAITQDTTKQASQILTLNCQPGGIPPAPAPSCTQVLDTGFEAGTQYVVPASTKLVLTSLDYYPLAGTGKIGIGIEDITSTPLLFEALLINNQSLESTMQFSSGIVMGTGLHPGVISSNPNAVVYLHGYLTAN